MNYSIVYASKTGNTRILAEAVKKQLPEKDCIYCGEPNEDAKKASRLYVGFWTDQGTCDTASADFLKTLKEKEVFLFGTAGFGGDPAYFEEILNRAKENLDESVTLIGTFMCQGKMHMAVRKKYEKMMEEDPSAPNLPMLIANFDKALSHPDETDLKNLEKTILECI